MTVPKGRLVDLSLPVHDRDPTFPWDPKCAVIVHNTIETIGYNITQLSMSTHQGTHLDAPYHFIETGATVDRVPLEQVCGAALLVDLSRKRPGEQIGVADFEPIANRITRGSRVVYRTGWDAVFPERRYFSEMPYLTVGAAEWLAQRGVALVGMDVPTPNPTDWMAVHHAVLGSGAVFLEGLAGLDQITRPEFWLCAAPLAIAGRDGAPTRAFAVLDD